MEKQLPENLKRSKRYYCNICKTRPDQLSHHKAHLKTHKHIISKMCLERYCSLFIMGSNIYTKICQNKVLTGQTTDMLHKLFEYETNIEYEKSEEFRHKFCSWRWEKQKLMDDMLKDFDKTLIPDQTDISWHQFIFKVIEDNETIKDNETIEEKKHIKLNQKTIEEKEKIRQQRIINEEKTNQRIKEIHEQTKNLLNSSIKELIMKTVEHTTENSLALLLYKIYNSKYRVEKVNFKLIWLDKTDSNIKGNLVENNLKQHISNDLFNIISEFGENLSEEDIKKSTENEENTQIVLEKYKSECIKCVNSLKLKSTVNNILREALHIFYEFYT
jgi:hypothetical protein